MTLLPQIIIIMKLHLLKLMLKMLFFLVMFILFVFVCLVMVQRENYEASFLSMLLFILSAMMFSHYKEQWISIRLVEDEQEDAVTE